MFTATRPAPHRRCTIYSGVIGSKLDHKDSQDAESACSSRGTACKACLATCWSCCYIRTQRCHTGSDALLEPGVYTLEDLRIFGRKQGWCPYFLARHMLAFANVVVYNYQYMLDPKVCCTENLHASYLLCMQATLCAVCC